MPDQTDDITDRGPQAGKTIGKLQLFSIWYTILPHGFLVKSLGLHTVIPSQIHSFGSEAETAIVAMFVKLISPLTCSIAQINEAIQITMPYTLAVYMVRDFQKISNPEGASEQTVGRLTGLLAACFCAAQFVSSFPWGRASDRFGRKPMLVMSNLSSCISVIAFGLSSSFAVAAALRLAGGFFNCTFVCLKSMIGESIDIRQQARPLSYLSLCWGLGTVVGPTLGGALSRPCQEFGSGFPFCGENGFLQKKPFFLPCFAVGVVSFVAFLSSLLVMEESLPRIVARNYTHLLEESEGLIGRDSGEAKDVEMARQTSSQISDGRHAGKHARDSIDVDAEEFPETLLGRGEEAGLLAPEHSAQRFTHTSLKIALGREEDRQFDVAPTSITPREGLADPSVKLVARRLAKESTEDKIDIVWYKDKEILLTILGYAWLCLLYNLLDEVTPIYSSADRSNGGLGLSTSQLAVPLAIGGISIFLWSMFFYPLYQEYLGVMNACRLGIVMTIPLCVGLALPSLLPIGVLGLQLFLASVLFFKNIMATNSFTSAVIMVNAAAPQKTIGAVNGASQAAASFVRAVGPALGGLMWALSVSIDIPGHQLLAFGLTGAGFLFPLVIFSYLKLPNLP